MWRNLWNRIREIEWFAVISLVFLAAGLVVALLIAVGAVSPLLQSLAIVLVVSAAVSALFSFRT